MAQVQFILYFIVPGYLILKVRSYFIPIKKGADLQFWLESILWGFIVNVEIKLLCKIPGTDWLIDNTNLSAELVAIVLAILTGITLAKVSLANWYRNVLKIFSNFDREPHANVWYSVLDHREGVYVRVYLKQREIVYCGAVNRITVDPNQDSRELYLSSFQKYTTGGNLLEDHSANANVGVLVNATEISSMEIFYPDGIEQLVAETHI